MSQKRFWRSSARPKRSEGTLGFPRARLTDPAACRWTEVRGLDIRVRSYELSRARPQRGMPPREVPATRHELQAKRSKLHARCEESAEYFLEAAEAPSESEANRRRSPFTASIRHRSRWTRESAIMRAKRHLGSSVSSATIVRAPARIWRRRIATAVRGTGIAGADRRCDGDRLHRRGTSLEYEADRMHSLVSPRDMWENLREWL